MKVAIVEFPGSHYLRNTVLVYQEVLNQEVYTVWHEEETLNKPDLVVIPGGASFGDHLRPGALVIASPICGPLKKFARDGGPMLGIGNGFQILCELGILPGILLENPTLKFAQENIHVILENINTPFTKNLKLRKVMKLPIACRYPRYYVDRRTIKDIEENGQVVFRYCDQFGDVDLEHPYCGTLHAIAGLTNRHSNVLGIMPNAECIVGPEIHGFLCPS